jgi:serine/threonine protein phosphatase PrpC
LRASGYTDVGRVREVNQDSFAAIDLIGLYIVADGMGGHAAGEKASLSAVTTAIEIFSAYDFEQQRLSGSDVTLGIEDVIKIALKEANNRIIQASISSIHLQGMGTTEVISVYFEDHIYFGNVGDSRGYLVRANEIRQLTRDHSVVQDLKDQGLITEEEAKVHPYRNVITRCLGMQADIDVDTFKMPLEAGDKILMCTDGLTNHVSNEEIRDFVFGSDDLDAICKKLVDKANERGGTDNITVVLLHYDGE